VGSTVVVPVQSVAGLVLGQNVSVQTAGGNSTTAGTLQITFIDTSTTPPQLTLLNPASPPTIPPASTTQAGLMNQVSGNSGDYVGGDNASHNLANAVTPIVTPVIYSVRLNSLNFLNNPNFEIDQRNILANNVYAAGNIQRFAADRWNLTKYAATGTLTAKAGGGKNAFVPGTNFFAGNRDISYNRDDPGFTHRWRKRPLNPDLPTGDHKRDKPSNQFYFHGSVRQQWH